MVYRNIPGKCGRYMYDNSPINSVDRHGGPASGFFLIGQVVHIHMRGAQRRLGRGCFDGRTARSAPLPIVLRGLPGGAHAPAPSFVAEHRSDFDTRPTHSPAFGDLGRSPELASLIHLDDRLSALLGAAVLSIVPLTQAVCGRLSSVGGVSHAAVQPFGG